LRRAQISTLNAAWFVQFNRRTYSGTLTVFAPDNAAFAAAGITDVNTVPVAKLDSILKYHVLGQTVGSAAVPASDTVKSILGLNIYASRNANGVFVNGISVKQADILASNRCYSRDQQCIIPPPKRSPGLQWQILF